MTERLAGAIKEHFKEVSEGREGIRKSRIAFSLSSGFNCLRICIGDNRGIILDRGYSPEEFGYTSILNLMDDARIVLKEVYGLSQRGLRYFRLHVSN